MKEGSAAAESIFGAWSPGIRSPVPELLRPYCTIFLSENVSTSYAKAAELHDVTGLEMSELVAFHPHRLLLHELLIRVTAELSVPDGEKIEDLGINFRQMTRTIFERDLEPELHAIAAAFKALRQQLASLIADERAAVMLTPARVAPTRPRGGLFAWLRRSTPVLATAAASTGWDEAQISALESKALATDDPARKAACRALARVMAALLRRYGRSWGTWELVSSIALDMASNECGADAIGRAIEPLLAQAAAREGYSLLPAQTSPVIMNTKGASASGKSTLRPLQKELAGSIGVKWSDFALISPDIWRKQLLDYEALGANYRYAGSFTGDELQIIDQKLDRYMARKAERGQMTHLLIDRFRFDSFAADSDEAGSNLLTRFGRVIYLFFMITPPASLVRRAWNRGLDVGRYKAVDDTLAHGVEAYAGMPQLFFTWVRRADKRVYFEFLDNSDSVKRGTRPRTVAFGTNEILNVLDIKCLLDIERYRRANVHATAADELFADPGLLEAAKNLGFLKQCIEHFREINFAEQSSGRVYLCMITGQIEWQDRDLLAQTLLDTDARTALEAVAPGVAHGTGNEPRGARSVRHLRQGKLIPTLGRWGEGA